MTMSRLTSFLAGAVSVAIIVGILAVAGVFDGGSSSAQPTTTTARSTTTPTPTTPVAAAMPNGDAVDVASVYRKVSPGVVFVESDQPNGQASGSGFVIDDAGDIVTNEHVVDGATSLKVRFGENGDAIPVKLLGADRSADLAVVRVDPSKVDGGLHPVTLGNSNGLQPGQPTIAIGSPFGLEGTVTSGIVSGLNRTIQAPSGFSISGAIQTDAAINPGNSGGPLLNGQGQVIGVNSQIATESGSNSGVGFAIPIDQVKRIVPTLEKGQKVQHAFLGVATGDAQSGGAQVGQVVGGGPAAKGGIHQGDRIIEIDGDTIHNADDLSAAVNDHQPGDKVQVVIERNGQRRTLTVTLGTQPQNARGQSNPGPSIP
jgi:putative serine protease PepD